jgi:hypothetical protein
VRSSLHINVDTIKYMAMDMKGNADLDITTGMVVDTVVGKDQSNRRDGKSHLTGSWLLLSHEL